MTSTVLPNPVRSFEDAERFFHRDLVGLSAAELWAERMVVRRALAALIREHRDPILWTPAGWPASSQAWLRERMQRVTQEQKRRGRVA